MHSTLYDVLIGAPFGLLLVMVTAFVGGSALYIFRRQGRDTTRNAAMTVLSEVRSAENALTGIKSRFFAVDRPELEPTLLIPNEHWSDVKHLLMEPLGDDWDTVDKFYTNCLAYDQAVRLDQANIDQLVTSNHMHLSSYYNDVVRKAHGTAPDQIVLDDDAINDYKTYENLYLSKRGTSASYVPARSVNAARMALVALDTMVTSSTAGQKLHKLAALKPH